MSGVLLYCRAGFEADAAAELAAAAAEVGIVVEPDVDRASVVMGLTRDLDTAMRLHAAVPLSQLVFARQWFVTVACCHGLPRHDRAARLAEAGRDLPGPVADLYLEAPDSDAGRLLEPVRRGLAQPLARALTHHGYLDRDSGSGLRCHVCLLDTATAAMGYATTANSAPWPMGVPRLKRYRGAASRSGLKLEEALLRLVPAAGAAAPAAGETAVDLGAAPGGWTDVLVRRGLTVIAVDNARLRPAVARHPRVLHRQADGFRYRPERPVDWLVCDMVDRPARVARLAGRWLRDELCRTLVVNFKLPMRRRREAVLGALDELRDALGGRPHRLACKHLYHDREEVTCCVGVK